MDPLTHGLAGAALGALVVPAERRRLGAIVGALAALAPDLDVLVASDTDPLLQLEVHRQYTHSVFVAPIIGALLAGLMTLVRRSGPGFMAWFPAATLGALSAGLLDACTSYGTKLFWPLSDERLAFNAVAVVDPVVTVTLLIAVVVMLIWRGVGASYVGLAVAVAYLSLGAVQHERATFAVRSLAEERDHVIDAFQVKPTLGNQLLWRSVYRTGEVFHVDAVRVGWFSRAIVYQGRYIESVSPEVLDALGERERRDVERFRALSADYLVAHPRHDGVIGDIRYAMSPDSIEPLWGIQPEGTCQMLREKSGSAYRMQFSPDGQVLAIRDGSQGLALLDLVLRPAEAWNPIHLRNSASLP